MLTTRLVHQPLCRLGHMPMAEDVHRRECTSLVALFRVCQHGRTKRRNCRAGGYIRLRMAGPMVDEAGIVHFRRERN